MWEEPIRKPAPLYTTSPLKIFPENVLAVSCHYQPATKLLFQDALGALGTNATRTALLQLGTRHCEKCRGTKHIWSLSHSWSCANMLAADNTRFVFRQLSHSHNPTKLTPFSLDRRMCHLSYQGQSVVLSLGRASPGCCSSWHGGDSLWLKSPELALIFPLCNKENKHKPVARAMQLLHQLWAWCYYVPRLYILYCLIQKRAQ